MNGKENASGQQADGSLGCRECQSGLQEYLDGTLDKKQSLRFFLHLRACATCQKQHELMQDLFMSLDSLPRHKVPADFDDAILAAVPYSAYQEMEPLRRERVPVYLEEHFLPQFVRSRVTRWSGLGLAVTAAAAAVTLDGPVWWPVAAGAGLVPELLVRLQGLGRRVVALGRAEG